MSKFKVAHEWRIGDEVEYVRYDGSLSGHFGFITKLERKISSIHNLHVEVVDRTCKSQGLACIDENGLYIIWYAEGEPAPTGYGYGIRLCAQAPAVAAPETRIGLVREVIDWSAHEELKRLALGNRK
jgi:hypothetical protein